MNPDLSMAQARRSHVSSRPRTVIALAALGSLLIVNRDAKAEVIDPAGDFLASYTGPKNGDLDVLTAEVAFNGNTFFFHARLDGTVGTTENSQYVFGMDRGQGTARFLAPLGLDGVLFDSVVVLTSTGGMVRDLISNVTTFTLAAGDIAILDDTISASVPLSALVTRGFAPTDYTFNLWPRLAGGTTDNIADFAPDNANARVRAVPEPGALALLGIGGIAACAAGIRKRNRASA